MAGDKTEHMDDHEERVTILETMRAVTKVTLRAGSRHELEEGVCSALVDSGLYLLAWIGTVDPDSNRVRSRAAVGKTDYLDEIHITVGDDETAKGPTGLAFDTQELQVIQQIADDPDFNPWREEALDRGFGASVAIPLDYRNELFGVLNLYSPRANAFQDFEFDLLDELGEDIGFAIDAFETRSALERSRDFLQRTAELTQSGGWEYDHTKDTFRLTDGSRRLIGKGLGDSPSLDAVLALFETGDRPRLEEAIERTIAHDEPFDITLTESDGDDARWFRMIGRPAETSGSGELVRGAIQDVTEEHRVQERLSTRNEQLLMLNRIVRHDIRNDMSIVLGWAAELADHVDSEGAGMLDRILESSQHVVDLTHALRDFIHGLEDESEQSLAAVDLQDVLQEELQKRRSAYPDATIEVAGEIPQIRVLANELLSVVFRNLLDNAVIHNDKADPRVELSVVEERDWATVRIADNGPGIPPDNRAAVLGRTEQGLDHPAAGLGLYLVDTLVDTYGGSLTIEANDPVGTVMVVRLRRPTHRSGEPDGDTDGNGR